MQTAIRCGGTVLPEITQLLDLQTADGQLHELSVQIDRLRAQQKQTEQRIVAEESTIDRLRERLSQLEHESRMKNLEVDELDMNIRRYQERLDTGIISFKEMQDLGAKIESERVRISTMEDAALVLMDTIEESRQALERAIADYSTKVEQFQSQIDGSTSRISGILGQVDGLAEERGALCDRIPVYLLKQYETLRQRSAEPIALIRNGTCSGCKLKLSGSTIERARGGMVIVTCEHCSRILYVDEFMPDS
jgi:predicted  nucleic acid-binding Zn-ribbon protein